MTVHSPSFPLAQVGELIGSLFVPDTGTPQLEPLQLALGLGTLRFLRFESGDTENASLAGSQVHEPSWPIACRGWCAI